MVGMVIVVITGAIGAKCKKQILYHGAAPNFGAAPFFGLRKKTFSFEVSFPIVTDSPPWAHQMDNQPSIG
jgi:hypothetical protein